MEKEKFKNWLLKNGYSSNTSNSYSYYIDKISDHLTDVRNDNINVYLIFDLEKLKKLVELYSTTGNYSEFGHKGNGTARNAIKALYKYRKFSSDLTPEIFENEDELEEEIISETNIINFSYEKDLKNSLISQIEELFPDYKIFGSENEGIEYLIEGKRIDVLLQKSDSTLLAIELKSGLANFKVFGQLSMYLGLLMERFPDKNIKGCIIAGEIDNTLISATKTNNAVSLMTYKMKLELQNTTHNIG